MPEIRVEYSTARDVRVVKRQFSMEKWVVGNIEADGKSSRMVAVNRFNRLTPMDGSSR